jgi:hypothetical protein
MIKKLIKLALSYTIRAILTVFEVRMPFVIELFDSQDQHAKNENLPIRMEVNMVEAPLQNFAAKLTFFGGNISGTHAHR